MAKLPRSIKPRKLITILKRKGFREISRKGSHRRFAHLDGRWTQIAVHAKPIPIGTLRAICRQAKIDPEDIQP